MKILQVISSVNPEGGGPVESLKQVSKILVEQGHNCEMLSADEPSAPWVKEFPFRLHALGPGWGRYQYSSKIVPWLREHVSEYDCVIVRGLWRYVSFAVWRGLQKSPVPYFVFTHGMLDPWFKSRYPLKHLQKYFCWLWGEYRMLRDAEAVLFTSEEERRLAKESFLPYRCNELVVRYGTADPKIILAAAREQFFAAHPELRDKEILLFLGRIHEKKGVDLLIDAFCEAAANNDALRLVLAGPDEQQSQEALSSRAASQGAAEKIIWTGMLSGEQKWQAFAAADVFVLPSHQENFGIAVVESLSCSTPVLISKRVNIWREVIEGGAGFAEEDSLAGTKKLLERWTALSAADREEMTAQARKLFLERFEIHAAAKHLLEVIGGRT